MAKLGKAVKWRRLERPYTRTSKYAKKNFIRGRPPNRIARYDDGVPQKVFSHSIHLISKTGLQIRDNAIESARQTSTRALENSLGKGNYYFVNKMYPHHILRENTFAAGAGADRMSTGMAHSYGKPIGVAAQVNIGKQLFSVRVNKENLAKARIALGKAKYKLPCSCLIVVEENKAE